MGRMMKDSGLEWLGEVPFDWQVRKVKHYYCLQTGFTPDTKNESFYDDENGLDWVNISDIKDGETIYETKKKISQLYLDEHKQPIIPKGSLMYSFKLSVGQTAFAGKPIYSNEAIASFLANDNINLHYLRYSSAFIVENAQENIYGAKILNQDLINNAFVPFPPLSEQQRIADFLDAKCAEIDSVIGNTEATIEEYKKLKQSVITEAVTKGIRGDRPMKPSGIEWIGDIPEEWEISYLKNEFNFGKGLPITKADLIESGIPVISYGQIHAKYNTGVSLSKDLIRYVPDIFLETNPQSLVSKNDFIFADTSEDMEGCGNCAYVDKEMVLFAGYHTIILHAKTSFSKKYFAYLFKTDAWRRQIRNRLVSVKVYSVSQKVLRATTVIIPNINEQAEIVAYLDIKCSEIDRIIETKKALISELQAYKKSIIYEYVTGKKEVV